ncbi:ribose-phosphate diphosphokinase [Desulforhabdus amnigena]|jgi:ribose-phosphate pyrophosphokinase|uniref:Ribose-phosphate pyrophosphokinase n=1 Tax=Desulforhabdus amnigena TaxID=40218 RepID=A0A9W6FRT3_9BACT|nr:ribose-phosphate pyrophosphokinase [Desulforhabdus amnigena]NLJ28588.1 ribose-phosphate pyrophosphokinase [Deltaproteobacteria bacterium]GLI33857.1 ribose-phosphate pyrophosphokinase [Desulforhabdus amnigena]
MATYGLKIFAGNSNPDLALQICESLEIPLGRALVTTFSDGEIRVEIGENVRGADVFVVQSGAPPVNDHLMELLVMIDALKRASARRITAVMPYYSYSRQDRKNKPRVPITARLVADLITRVGTHRILTLDLHAGQIQGFFDIPVDNLYASPILLPYIKEHFNGNLVIVSPDAGGVPRARAYASQLKAGLALIDKRRSDVNQAEALNIIGEVAGKTAVVLDDMVDTAGTLVEATKSLLEKGAQEVHACVTHPILSGPAVGRIENSPLKSLVVTDTVPLSPQAAHCEKIICVPACRLFSTAIRNIHNEDSISTLFEILH